MAIFTVTNNNDSGLGSLRQAIADANAAIGLDTIEFDHNLSGQEITLTSGILQITDDLTINGLGADLLTISGNNADRVFLVDDEQSITAGNTATIEVIIDGLTITEGSSFNAPDFFGSGGIINLENLTILNSNISDNAGSGVINLENLTILNSNIADNTGSGILVRGSELTVDNSSIFANGQGISSTGGDLTVTDSEIFGNTVRGVDISFGGNLKLNGSEISDNTGGGLGFFRGSFEIDNSIISGNTTTGTGGGISTFRAFGTISNSQIINNIANSDSDGNGNGGGIGDFDATSISFNNTIIAGNINNSPANSENRSDIFGFNAIFTSTGYNFIGDITGIGGSNPFVELGDLFGTNAHPLSLDNFIEGTSGNDSLSGTSEHDRLEGGDGNDILRGRGGIDVLLGDADHDKLFGGDGNDTLNGGDGDDVLYGGTGQDILIGGAGSDRFTLVSGVTDDLDIIRDYHDGVDRLILTGDLSFDDLTIVQNGANTRIEETATNQTLAILTDTDVNNINQHDFEFGAEDNGIRVEAEDYVHFYDTTTGNTGCAYRHDDVDIEVTTDLGGGFNVGWIAEGEWLTYDIDIAESGLYQVVARVASNTTDGRVHHLDISLDGESTSLGFDATGGWQSWTDVTGDNLHLSAGHHELRLDMGSAGFNINYIDLIPV